MPANDSKAISNNTDIESKYVIILSCVSVLINRKSKRKNNPNIPYNIETYSIIFKKTNAKRYSVKISYVFDKKFMNRSIFNLWQPRIKNDTFNEKSIKTVNLNFGPQHPAAHGVLRLILQLNGEIIEKADSHIGLLHRGSEKLMEDKIYLHSLPYFDRFDYVSMMVQEHAYCLAIESLLGTTNYSATFVQVRTLFDELTRILNHMLAIACHALDVGSMSPIF